AWIAAYTYAETRLMEAQASWLPYIPQIELKIELSYQLYDDALHIQAMRNRLPEIGWFQKDIPAPNAKLERFFNELTNTPHVIEQLVGVYRVGRPALAVCYRQHLAQEDTVANRPTVQFLEAALRDHESYAVWGQQIIMGLAGE